jgi:hypothetical protein
MDISQKIFPCVSIFNIQNLDVNEYFLERERERDGQGYSLVYFARVHARNIIHYLLKNK